MPKELEEKRWLLQRATESFHSPPAAAINCHDKLPSDQAAAGWHSRTAHCDRDLSTCGTWIPTSEVLPGSCYTLVLFELWFPHLYMGNALDHMVRGWWTCKGERYKFTEVLLMYTFVITSSVWSWRFCQFHLPFPTSSLVLCLGWGTTLVLTQG